MGKFVYKKLAISWIALVLGIKTKGQSERLGLVELAGRIFNKSFICFSPLLCIFLIVPTLFVSLSACSMEGQMNNINSPDTVFKVKIGEIDIDVPTRYLFEDYKVLGGHWPRPKLDRYRVNNVVLTATFPGFDGFSPTSKDVFEKPGFDGKIRIRVSDVEKFSPQLFFLNIFDRLKPQNYDNTPLGYMSFRDEVTSDLVFLNHKTPRNDLIVITCNTMGKNKGCELVGRRLDKTSENGLALRYWFGIRELSRINEIDNGVDDFLKSLMR